MAPAGMVVVVRVPSACTPSMLRASSFSVFVSAFDEWPENSTLTPSPGGMPGPPGGGGAVVWKTKVRASPSFCARAVAGAAGPADSLSSDLSFNSTGTILRATFVRGSRM